MLFFQRRGAISYDSSDQTALYIRMLGKHNFILLSVDFVFILFGMRYLSLSSLFITFCSRN